ncbi:MAG: hypothetical protein FWE28_01600 [Oscillospiraceae bacterium]|nr:hypothetical protein [Oscillospiraceae bacterium]
MTKLKRLRNRLDGMATITYNILKIALLATCGMAFTALALFYSGGGSVMSSLDANKIAWELITTGSVTLLVATIVSVVAEEITMKK